MSSPFRHHALRLLERGILAIPLERDAQGFPKKPFTQGWTELERNRVVVESLPWERAEGIGIVLGGKSSNLCAIDVDDESLADTLIEMFKGSRPPYVVRTARRRCHVYVKPVQPSNSTRTQIMWDNRNITVELKANGTQVAAPPTPGYSVAIKGAPVEADTLSEAWATILAGVNTQHSHRLQLPLGGDQAANYPSAWRDQVPKEERNNSLYIEAHRLREAGMPLDQAIDMLQLRIEQRYASGEFSWHEAKRTIESAYRKGVPAQKRSLWDGPPDNTF